MNYQAELAMMFYRPDWREKFNVVNVHAPSNCLIDEHLGIFDPVVKKILERELLMSLFIDLVVRKSCKKSTENNGGRVEESVIIGQSTRLIGSL